MTAPSSPHTDEEILRSLRAGEPDGVNALLVVHGPRVLGVLQSRFQATVPAFMFQDALTDTVMGFLRHPHRLNDVHNLAGLLYVATRNAGLRMAARERARQHAPLPDDADTTMLAAPNDDDQTTRRSARIRRALDDLSAGERDILDLEIASDFKISAKDIARMLDTTEATVFSTRNRIKSKLSKFLEAPAAKPTRT